MKKVGIISNRGGARPGAGRPAGASKAKLSVSIDKTLYETAKKSSQGSFSSLVESLLLDYTRRIKKS